MTMVGCYDLLLECDGDGCTAGEYGDRWVARYNFRTAFTCRRVAQQRGWKLCADDLCLCPSCVRRGAQAVP